MRLRLMVVLLSLSTFPVWALSNAVTVEEMSGSTQTNRVLQIPRYFAAGEICGYPQPYTGGSAMTYWQADVTVQYAADASCAAGYAKFAVITVQIPSLAANGSVSIEFRSSALASSGGSGLTPTGMLNFDPLGGGAKWGAGIRIATGGIAKTASARAMITAGHYQVLSSGPLRTEVLVREGPDDTLGSTTRSTSIGYQCTANCTAPYATATWADNSAYYSMRPSYVLTFFSHGDGSAAWLDEDAILDNSWMDRAQDQLIGSAAIYTDSAENTTACYTAPAAFVLPFRSRFYENCTIATPGAVNIDFNRAYVTYSKVLPAYGLQWTIGAAAKTLEVSDFNGTDQGQTTTTSIAPQMGWGQMSNLGSSTGGGYKGIGFMWRFEARYVTSFDAQMLAVVLGEAKAQMHIPLRYSENNTRAAFYSGGAAKAFGRDASLDARPTFSSSTWNLDTSSSDAVTSPSGACVKNASNGPSACSVCSAPSCMITCFSESAQLAWCSALTGTANTVNNWGQDIEHHYAVAFVPYLFTGKRVYLESLWTAATWVVARNDPGDTLGYARKGSAGLIIDGAPRGIAWPMRTLGEAALISPDTTPEAVYFRTKLNNNLEMHEGRLNITDGDFAADYTAHPATWCTSGFPTSNPNSETTNWWYGRCWLEGNASNPLGFSTKLQPTDGDGCYSCDATVAGAGYPAWMHQYTVVVYHWLADVGFPADYIAPVLANWDLHLAMDRAYAPSAASIVRYYIPGVKWDRNTYMQTWTSMGSAYIDSAALARPVAAGDTTIYILTRGDTIAGGNNYDGDLRCGDCYWKVDNEIVHEYSHAASAAATPVTSVNATTHRITSASHGYSTGWRVRLNGTTMDSGAVGNANCHVSGTATPRVAQWDCDFWVNVIDTNTLELYSDSALTQIVPLNGDGSGLYMYQEALTIDVRGALGTTAASHAMTSAMAQYPLRSSWSQSEDPTGSHSFMYMSGLSAAVDLNLTATAESGGTITAQRAFEAVEQVTTYHYRNGSNSACTGAGDSVDTCDNPQWGIRPRPLIRNLRWAPGSTTATAYYTAPDANACKLGVSAAPFASTDDNGDTADSRTARSRSITASGLTSGTTYYYRLTCGPMGGAARAAGTFNTQ